MSAFAALAGAPFYAHHLYTDHELVDHELCQIPLQDFMPTFASLAGVPLPADRVYDGIDLRSVLLNASDVGHATLFHAQGGGCGKDCKADQQMKAVPAMRFNQ
jgi:hypothetical protein